MTSQGRDGDASHRDSVQIRTMTDGTPARVREIYQAGLRGGRPPLRGHWPPRGPVQGPPGSPATVTCPPPGDDVVGGSPHHPYRPLRLRPG